MDLVLNDEEKIARNTHQSYAFVLSLKSEFALLVLWGAWANYTTIIILIIVDCHRYF